MDLPQHVNLTSQLRQDCPHKCNDFRTQFDGCTTRLCGIRLTEKTSRLHKPLGQKNFVTLHDRAANLLHATAKHHDGTGWQAQEDGRLQHGQELQLGTRCPPPRCRGVGKSQPRPKADDHCASTSANGKLEMVSRSTSISHPRKRR